MAACLLVTDLRSQALDDERTDAMKQSISEYLKNVEKSVEVLAAYYEKQIQDLNIELAKLKEKEKDLLPTEAVCSNCRIEKTCPKTPIAGKDPNSRNLEDIGATENQHIFLVPETVPERLPSSSKRLSNVSMSPQSCRKDTESFVPETCDFPNKLDLESYFHLPMESSTPLFAKSTFKKPRTSRLINEHPVSSDKNDGKLIEDDKSRPSVDETVLDGSLVVLKTFKDRNSLPLPDIGENSDRLGTGNAETMERDRTEESYEHSAPSSPVIGRNSNSFSSKREQKSNTNKEKPDSRRPEICEDGNKAVNVVGRQLFKRIEDSSEPLEIDILPETPSSKLDSPNNTDDDRPSSPVIASQFSFRRVSARKITDERQETVVLEVPLDGESESTAAKGVDSIFKETILEDLGENLQEDKNEGLDSGTENDPDGIIESVQIMTSTTAKLKSFPVGSEELRPKAERFTYTRTSRLADGQSRLKLVGTKANEVKRSSGQSETSARNKGKKCGQPNFENTVVLDDSFDVVATTKEDTKATNFKYQEVVRKQAERKKLTGKSCKECQSYYKHSGLSSEEIQKRMTSCSRHREKFPNPNTPPNFWQLDFPPTPDEEEEIILRPKRLKKSPLALLDDVEPREVTSNERPVRSKRRRLLARRF